MQFCFADHTLDTERRELLRGGEPVALQPQVFDLLVYLVQNRDRVVSKDDLIASVWGGRIVSDSTLTSRINAARTAVGDSGEDQRLIRTIPRKGLRFVGEVTERSRRRRAGAPTPQQSGQPPRGIAGCRTGRPSPCLPFDNMSGDREQEYFSDGISEDIITALSKLRWFFVIARNSSFIYKGRPSISKPGRRGTRRRATWSKAACARAATACASRRSSTTSRPAVTSGRSITTAT